MFTIALPLYKYKLEFPQVLKCIGKLNQNLISEIVCVIQPTEDQEKIMDALTASKLNFRYVMNKQSIGMVGNWNRCIEECNSNYLIINHDDDYLYPNILESYKKLFEQNPQTALIGCKAINSKGDKWKNIIKMFMNRVPARMKYYEKDSIKDFVNNDFTLDCSGVAFNLSLLKNQYLFSSEFPYSADEELWPRILRDYPIIVLRKYFIIRNIRENGQNYEYETWHKKDFVEQYVNIRKKIIEYGGFDEEIRDIFRLQMTTAFKDIEKHTGTKIDIQEQVRLI